VTSYKHIEFVSKVYHPKYASKTEKKTVMIAGGDITISREGDVVTITDAKSGRSVETPWANVGYAEVLVTETPASKSKKAA